MNKAAQIFSARAKEYSLGGMNTFDADEIFFQNMRAGAGLLTRPTKIFFKPILYKSTIKHCSK